jgi:C-terminal domain 10 of the ABC-three component (ABC-3C) systems
MAVRSKAREYKPSTTKRLHALSGNQCAAPNCTNALIARDGETIISKICHIESAKKGGARWNTDMTDDERRHFNNLILLCDECHSIIDNKENESKYPVSMLKDWKKQHESTMTYSILNKNPSLLNILISAISEIDLFVEETTSQAMKAFDIDEKIEYNDIKRNKALIDNYKVFYKKINSLYQTLEEQGSFKKENLLRNIKNIYVKTKGKYIENSSDPIRIIRENADNIIEDVQEELLIKAEKHTTSFSEDISVGVSLIMVDSFMRCKILEEPLTK